jgi:lipid-A-disaccharide synthase
MVASGTATLECCILGVPMTVLYKVSLPSYLAARRMINVSHASLVNLIAGRQVVPEFMQSDAVPENIAGCVERLLDGPASDKMKKDLLEVRAKLGGPGASDRAACEILKLLS